MLSNQLRRKLKGKVYYSVPKGHASPYERLEQFLGKLAIIEGLRHENLEQAEILLAREKLDLKLEDFRVIFSLIRNPYQLIISRYNYLRNIQRHNLDGKAAQLARQGDFKKFVLYAPEQCTINKFLPIGKFEHLTNHKIIRFEDMAETVNELLKEYLSKAIDFSRVINSSGPKDVKKYICDHETEVAIYDRYRVLFENGYYERMDFE